MPPLITVVGPTAAGKTKLAAALAYQLDGEIISADSRQVYRGLDLASGKDYADYQYRGRDIPYQLIDVVSPRRRYTVYDFQRAAYRAIDGSIARGHQPLLVGGTGLYVDAVARGYQLAPAGPSAERAGWSDRSLTSLVQQLKRLDPETANSIDLHNRRRVERALEIIQSTGESKLRQDRMLPRYEVVWLGVTRPTAELERRISRRLDERLKAGMIEEIAELHRRGLSWRRCEELGLECRYIARYLRGELSHEEMRDQLARAIIQFAKRQMTWFKRNKDIHWVETAREARQILSNQ